MLTPLTPEGAQVFLAEASKLFKNSYKNGDGDEAYWASVFNAERCNQIAGHIAHLEKNLEAFQRTESAISEAAYEILRLTGRMKPENLLGLLDRQEVHLKAYQHSVKVLEDRDRILSALEAAGVDNWEGYSEAMRCLSDEEDED